jgi:hypothetical protein
MAAITAGGLVAVYIQWAAVNTAYPAVVAQAVTLANAKILDGYTDDDLDTERRYLEASAWLFEHPYARDMLQVEPTTANPYRMEATRRDVLTGAAIRAPWWTIPADVT